MQGAIVALALAAGAGFAGPAPASNSTEEARTKHASIPAYEGTKTCAGCHEKQVKEMASSLHYQQQGPAAEAGGAPVGMMVSYSAPPSTSAGHNWIGILRPGDATKPDQPAGCALCHPGLGAKPNSIEKLTQSDYENIDCLLCHAPGYRRTVVKDGDRLRFAPAEGVDALAAARAVSRPTSDMCLRCHLSAGGGPNVKHGVIPTSPAVDVHLAKGLSCVNCHVTKGHRIAGGADLKLQELTAETVACTNCHEGQVHRGPKSSVLAKHTARIACQTCHVPKIARDPKFPTVVHRDFTKPVFVEKTGLYAPTDKVANDIVPEYRWWNRKSTGSAEPALSRKDEASKLYPWKRVTFTVLSDARSGEPVFIKFGLYLMKGDPVAAARKGAQDAQQAFSGEVKGSDKVILLSLNHQVAPKAEALACAECHSSHGLLDFESLGYSRERARVLMRTVQ
jgi:hypothetical protein